VRDTFFAFRECHVQRSPGTVSAGGFYEARLWNMEAAEEIADKVQALAASGKS